MRKQRSMSTISIQFESQRRQSRRVGNRVGGRLMLLLLLCCPAATIAPYSGSAYASEITITVAGPASGPHSDRTQQMLAGARRAASVVNANGGIKGATVKIDTADDGCSAEMAKATATALTIRKTDLVIGHPCASAANAAADIYANAQTVFIATGTRHRGLRRGASDTTTFRISGRDDVQGDEAARYLVENFKGETIAVVHDRTRASTQIADDVTAALQGAGAKPPISGTVVGGDKDFPLLTAKIKSAAAIFYAGYPLEAGMLYTQLRQAGSAAVFLMSDSGGTDEFTATFANRAEGVLIMRPRFSLNDETVKPTASASIEGRIANADETLAAAAVAAYAAAANSADSVNAPAVAHELSARAYNTADGVVAFDAKGDARRPSYDIYKWTGAAWIGAEIRPNNP